jgi:hypothetical protein
VATTAGAYTSTAAIGDSIISSSSNLIIATGAGSIERLRISNAGAATFLQALRQLRTLVEFSVGILNPSRKFQIQDTNGVCFLWYRFELYRSTSKHLLQGDLLF